MMKCKAIATLMESNLKLLCDASLETVDATMYRKMTASLMYLMDTRLDICFAMNTLSQFQIDSRCVHLIVTKHVLRYLKGTIQYGLNYVIDKKITMYGFVDFSWAGSITNSNNNSGCYFSLGYGMIS